MSCGILTLLTVAALGAPMAQPASTCGVTPPFFGYVPVGSSTGDDRGPSHAVMVSAFMNTDTCIATLLGPAWERSQAEDPGTGWREAEYDFGWFDEIVAPYQKSGAVLLGYAHIHPPDWLEEEYGTDAFWERVEHYLEAYFRKSAEEGVFYHIFENEPDGYTNTRPDWMDFYLTRLRHAHAAAKRADPRHQMIGANMFSTRHYPAFYERGFKEICDVVGFHNYSDNPHTGNDLRVVIELRRIMERYGDGDKLIFLGEGWGPGRELSRVQRTSPDEPISPLELQDLRDYVINGYRNLTTKTESYDPAWLLGAYFFTLNDNWGSFGWRARATEIRDETGRLLTYNIDGYNVGLYVEPRFYNGGMATYYGVSKDTLLDVFPGHHVALANPGFEYEERGGAPWGWTAEGRAFVDRSVRLSGRRSLRLESVDGAAATVTQWLPDTTLAEAREGLRVELHRFGLGVAAGNRLHVELLTEDGVATAWALEVEDAWRPARWDIEVPAGAKQIGLRLRLHGPGPVWVDNCFLVSSRTERIPALEAFVYDSDHQPIAGATVHSPEWPERIGENSAPVSDAEGRVWHQGSPAGAYTLIGQAPGYEPRTLDAVTLSPGSVRTAGFELVRTIPQAPSEVRLTDTRTGGSLRLDWTPAERSDHRRVAVHRSTSSLDLGERLAIVEGDTWTDSGVQDGEAVFYTLVPVDASDMPLIAIEEAQKRTVGLRSSYGEPEVPYDVHEDADWDAAVEFVQTFVATDDCVLITARCIAAATDPILDFRILKGGYGGEPIGPPRRVPATANHWAEARWAVGEIPLVKGETYGLSIRGSNKWSIYHTRTDEYALGDLILDGTPSRDAVKSGNSVDMWSTIRCARHPEIHIDDIRAEARTGGAIRFRWTTRLDCTSELHLADDTGEGGARVYRSEGREHEVVITGLEGGRRYRYWITGAWRDLSSEESPAYFVTARP